MSVTVVVPAASATRHPSVWSLQRPDGGLTLEAVLRPLDLTNVARVVPVVLRADVDAECGGDVRALEAYLAEALGLATTEAAAAGAKGAVLQILALDEPTDNATATVCVAIEKFAITGPLFVKDCDGAFPHVVTPDNCVVVLPITSANVASLHDLPSKSFADECGGVLTNIVEKHIVNDLVCVGGFGFSSAAAFVAAQRKVCEAAKSAMNAGGGPGRVYTSHMVLQMLVEDEAVFKVVKVATFDDWKTTNASRATTRMHRNLIVDLEGVLICPKTTWLASRIAGGAGGFSAKEFVPIAENVEALKRAVVPGKTKVVILSTLEEAARAGVTALLADLGIPCDSLVLGVQSCSSTLVSAHDAVLVPHPGATAYSVPSGSATLEDVLS